MNWSFKKTLVALPVMVLSLFYLRGKFHSEFHLSRMRDLGAMAITFILLFLVIVLDIARRKELDNLRAFVLCTFYVYVFAVLILTGYFDLFRRISENGWAHNLITRINHRENINLVPFKTIKIYKLSQKQIWGNLLMLMPLAFYVPMLAKSKTTFLRVFFIALLTSTLIELLQLLTNFRSSDVDDIILNTTGAVIGYFIFRILSSPQLARERKPVMLTL